MKALVIFGSGSDEPTYSEICKALKKNKIPFEAHVASAHRTPALVEKLVAKKWSFIIAGAGVAAALPGVVAALTIRPVIGIPVPAAFGGLDAFLSIMQMPPGIPVVCSPVDGLNTLKQSIKYVKKSFFGVNFIGEKNNEKLRMGALQLVELGIPVMISDTADKDAININVFKGSTPKKNKKGEFFTINVPLLKPGKANDAVKIMKTPGFWVGLGRVDNAVLAAIQLMNDKGQYDAALIPLRKKGADKVKKSNKETAKKYNKR